MRQLTSSALWSAVPLWGGTRGTEYCRHGGVICRLAAAQLQAGSVYRRTRLKETRHQQLPALLPLEIIYLNISDNKRTSLWQPRWLLRCCVEVTRPAYKLHWFGYWHVSSLYSQITFQVIRPRCIPILIFSCLDEYCTYQIFVHKPEGLHPTTLKSFPTCMRGIKHAMRNHGLWRRLRSVNPAITGGGPSILRG